MTASGQPFCTGVSAAWCPRCGDCTCDRNEDREESGLSTPDCPLHSHSSEHAEARWLILTLTEPGHGEVCLWWKPEGAGYTTDLDEAGRYTESEAKNRAAGRPGHDRAVHFSDVEGRAKRVVPLTDEDWAEIRAARRVRS